MTTPTLTPKQEKFCQYIVAGKNQSEAYRAVYNVKGSTKKTINEKACRLGKMVKIKARVKELMVPVVAQAQVQRVDWVRKAERYYFADVRNMFDTHGNVIDIPLLDSNEAAMIAGFEIVEDFTKVRKASGGEDAVPTGYTKKFKLVDPMKAHEYFGKVMGFIDTEDDDSDEAKRAKSMQVIFVNVNMGGNGHTNGGAVKVVNPPKVNFVGSR